MADGDRQRLLERWQREGDLDALDELLRAELSGLKRRLKARNHRAGSPVTERSASEILVEAAGDVARASPKEAFRGVAGLRAYLLRAAWRRLWRRVRERRRVDGFRSLDAFGPIPDGSASGPTRLLASAEERDVLRYVVSLLEPDARALLERVYLHERSVDAVAAELGVSRDALDMRLLRARRRLEEKLVPWRELFDLPARRASRR